MHWSKSDFRRQARARREASVCRDDASVEHLASFLADELSPLKRAVLYEALPGELDVSGLVDHRLLPEHRFALTRTPMDGFKLTLHDWYSPRERHPLGINQPIQEAPLVPDCEIGAVLVPGLLFDERGGRLGFGAGYFDRFLDRLGNLLLVGISTLPLEAALPVETHDVAMSHLLVVGDSNGVSAVPGWAR